MSSDMDPNGIPPTSWEESVSSFDDKTLKQLASVFLFESITGIRPVDEEIMQAAFRTDPEYLRNYLIEPDLPDAEVIRRYCVVLYSITVYTDAMDRGTTERIVENFKAALDKIRKMRELDVSQN